MSAFPQALADRLAAEGVVAVLVIDEVGDAVPLAQALLAGGVRAMELTLRTPAALESLRAIRAEVPEMMAGIGTILKVKQVREAAAAGAAFGVAPGTNPTIVRAAHAEGLPFAPGVVTPSDVEAALALECHLLKFFPAEPSGGLDYLQSLAAPFSHLGIRYLPLGGISLANLAAYLANPAVLAVGGSWLAPRNLVREKNWVAIRNLAEQARERIDAARRVQGTSHPD